MLLTRSLSIAIFYTSLILSCCSIGALAPDPIYTADLVGWYDFEEGSGNILNDKSGFAPAMALSGHGPYQWVVE